jgi:putative oxidoreductase
MKNKILNTRPLNTDVAALLLRLIFGGLFIYHGYDKIDHYHLYLSMSKDIIGIGTKLSYNLVTFAEFFCGFFVAIGFLTRLTVTPLIISMSVAFFIVHSKDPFQIKELAFLFLLLCIPVFILGSGKYSADALLFKKRNKIS